MFSAWPWFLPICLAMALHMFLAVLDSETFAFFHRKQLNFFHASLYRWVSFKIKLTLDLSRYIWKSVGRDTWTCNFFSSLLNCPTTCTWSLEKCTICNGIHWKLCRNDQITHRLWKKLLFGVPGRHYKVCFSLAMILPICLAMALHMF